VRATGTVPSCRRWCASNWDDIALAMQAAIGDPDAAPVRVLLWGPPGVGKTEIMRALSRHLGLYTLSAAPGDLAGSSVGQTSIAVKNLFTRARAQAPALLLIDAFDENFAVDERYARLAERRTQFLIELDAVGQVGAVNIVAEAHDTQKVDPAILARDFRLVEIPLPDEDMRRKVLERQLKTYAQRLDPDVEDACAELASLLAGKTGRDLSVLVPTRCATAFEQAREAGRNVDEITVTRDLFFDDDMVIARTPRSHRAQAPAMRADLWRIPRSMPSVWPQKASSRHVNS
jgi:AAA+ superfamily predicted ATPase